MGNRLSGKTAIVTGASRGIGREVAILFAKEGADVCVNYARDAASAKLVSEEIERSGSRALMVRADVSDAGEVRRMVARVSKELGPVDILVNNAGILRTGDLFEIEERKMSSMFAVNIYGIINCTKEVRAQMMGRRYGKIVNITSIAGIGTAWRGTTPYAISKGAVITLTKRLALELGGYGINVNAVAPGYVKTDMTTSGKTKKQFESTARIARERSILARIGSPEEIANVVLFFASDESSFITGQILSVDGGRMDFVSHSM